MEKRTPHYKLNIIKALIQEGQITTTLSAKQGASALGLTYDGLLDIVRSLEPTDFYKSMTTYANHRIWQDVYRPRVDIADLYIKLTVSDKVVVVSFKEL